MDKTVAQNLLMGVQPGNFLLRFADSDPGGISVTWVSGKQERVLLTPGIVLALFEVLKHKSRLEVLSTVLKYQHFCVFIVKCLSTSTIPCTYVQ